MEVVPYSEDAHFLHLCRWLYDRGSYIPYKREMPEVGYVVLDDKEIIAMGFIRRVEGGCGQLDGLATNPDSSASSRNAAIDLVVEQLLTKAKELGIAQLIAYTMDEHTLTRSARHGFKKLPHALIAVDLSSKPEV